HGQLVIAVIVSFAAVPGAAILRASARPTAAGSPPITGSTTWASGFADIDARVRAWIAHAEHADTWRLRHAIFRGGRFDPANTLEAWTAPCRRVVRGGSWNNNPQNLRSANRNRNTTDNRNNNLGFRVASTLSARAGVITVAPGAH
ncbi:MAG: SUMF1/EgtB/PvdO family nonheme iron enzyme, partial [Methylocella sp.]